MTLPSAAPSPHPGHHLSGMVYAITGYAVMTCFDTTLKYVSRQGYHQLQIMATVGAFCALTVAMIALSRGGLHLLAARRPQFQALRAGLSLISFFCGFYAIRHIPLVDFYGIIFAVPILITLLSVFWLKEYVGWPRWVSVAAGFIGVTIVLRDGTSHAATTVVELGYFSALACALLNAVSTVMVRRYGRQEPTLTFAFYAALCNLAISGSLCWFSPLVPYALPDLLLLMLAGILVGFGSVCLMTAFQNSPPAAVAPFQYTQIVWGGMLGYLVFGTVPTVGSLSGAAIVIASGYFVFWREARLARTLKRAAQTMTQAAPAEPSPPSA